MVTVTLILVVAALGCSIGALMGKVPMGIAPLLLSIALVLGHLPL